jgi:hypothetical protein
MHWLTLTKLKDFLSIALLTGGFALLSVGVGTICGTGAGEIAGGISLVALHHWWTKSDG